MAIEVHGMMFDQFTIMIEATAAGLGVALVPTFLADDELACGRLVAALPTAAPVAGAYYLVWPAERAAYPPLAAFRQWIHSAAADGPSGEHA